MCEASPPRALFPGDHRSNDVVPRDPLSTLPSRCASLFGGWTLQPPSPEYRRNGLVNVRRSHGPLLPRGHPDDLEAEPRGPAASSARSRVLSRAVLRTGAQTGARAPRKPFFPCKRRCMSEVFKTDAVAAAQHWRGDDVAVLDPRRLRIVWSAYGLRGDVSMGCFRQARAGAFGSQPGPPTIWRSFARPGRGFFEGSGAADRRDTASVSEPGRRDVAS